MSAPRATASATVRRIVDGSPACAPQAMLTDVATAISAASSGAPSPTSQLRSTFIAELPVARAVDADEAHAISDVEQKRVGPREIEDRQRRAPHDAPAARAIDGVHARLAPRD